jgi:hypothetical protein
MNRLLCALALASLNACSAARASAPADYAASVAESAPPPSLDRSLFAQRGSSGLSEADLGRILDAPMELRLPARIGVAALAVPFQPLPPARLEGGVEASRALGEALEGSGLVTVATSVATQLPTGGGLEGLRELAARYRAPYLLLYSERFEDRSHCNGLSVLWITVIGGLLTPSRTLAAEGVLEASLLDVRTGTLLFTVQEHLSFSSAHLPIGASAAWDALRRDSTAAATKALAERVVGKLQRLAKAAGPEPEPVALRLSGGEVPPGGAE